MKREPVPPSNERDKWLKRLMPRATTAAGPCLDTETFAAWADGALSGKALAAAEQHVSGCSRCLAMAAAMQRTMPEPEEPAPDRRALWRWIVPLTAAAAAVAIWIVVPQPQDKTAQLQQHADDQDKPRQTYAMGERESVPASPPPSPSSAAAEAARDKRQARTEAVEESRSFRSDASENRLRKESDDFKREDAPAELKSAQEPERPQSLNETVTLTAPGTPPSAGAVADADMAAKADAAAKQVQLRRSAIMEATASDPRIVWRVFNGTDIQRTTDGGKTWIKTSRPPLRVDSIRDVDALRATVTVSDGRTLTTTDGGATWVVQEKPAAPF